MKKGILESKKAPLKFFTKLIVMPFGFFRKLLNLLWGRMLPPICKKENSQRNIFGFKKLDQTIPIFGSIANFKFGNGSLCEVSCWQIGGSILPQRRFKSFLKKPKGITINFVKNFSGAFLLSRIPFFIEA